MRSGDVLNAKAEEVTRSPGRDDLLTAAISLLQHHGPAAGGLQFRADGVGEVLGISRTTLYKRWASMTELSADFLCFNAVYADSWMHRLLRTDPCLPFSTIAAEIFAADGPEVGVTIRAAISMRPDGDDLRNRTHAADRHWFAQLDDWFARHLAHRQRRAIPEITSVQAALVLVTTVAGFALLGSITTQTRDMLPPSLDAPTAAVLLDGLYQRLTTTASTPPTDPLPAGAATPTQHHDAAMPGVDRVQLADLETLSRALFVDTCPARTARLLKPVRIVHTRHLARAVSLTERRLNAIWPTAADLNGDVGAALIRRSLRSSAEVLARLFAGAAGAPVETARRRLPAAMQRLVALGGEDDTTAPFAALSALQDPPVAARLAAECDHWLRDLSVVTAATLHVLQLQPDNLSVTSLTPALVGAALGAQRLAAMHPEVLGYATATGEGLMGFGIAQLVLSTAR